LAAEAQQSLPDAQARIAILIPYARTDAESHMHLAEFRNVLMRLGWIEGRNLEIVHYWTGGDTARLPELAKEVVAARPTAILARSTAVTAALLRETRSTPIVFVVVSDPVGDGFVSSMARPGGNVTGFTNVEASLAGKWLEILRELAPATSRVAVLYGSRTSPGGGSYYLRLVQQAAAVMGMTVVATPLDAPEDIIGVAERISEQPGGGLVALPDATTTGSRKSIIDAATRYKLPLIYSFRYVAAEGALASYGVDVADLYRGAAGYVDRILRGAHPKNLPVQAPTKLELTINAKTARALGLTIPPTLLARADEVIE
jgi:putative tryptophan/tyrosine transport system substrate-binding protein